VCLGEGRYLGLESRDLAEMSWAMKMLCAVTTPRGWLCAFALRRRFLFAFLLSVCVVLSGVFMGIILAWLAVGLGVLVVFLLCDFLASFVFMADFLHCDIWLFWFLVSGFEV